MPIFSRRTIQRILDENAQFLTSAQLEQHVNKLNSNTPTEVLGQEWESIWLNAFSKIGTVRHEPDLGGSTQIDLHFTSRQDSDEVFIADITSVSDDAMHKANPVRKFEDLICKHIERRGLRLASFSYSISSCAETRLKAKQRIKIPEEQHIARSITKNARFNKWLNGVVSEPSSKTSFLLDEPDSRITFAYDPAQRYFSGNYPSYRHVLATDSGDRHPNPNLRNLQSNVLYNKLKDKAGQLKKSGIAGITGVILCDAGCEMIRVDGGGMIRGVRQVIDLFCQKHTSVSFIVVARFTASMRNIRSGPVIDYILIDNEHARYRASLKVLGDIQAAIHELPTPIMNAESAREWIASIEKAQGRSHAGGLEMDHGQHGVARVKISARALLELLAGTVDQRMFFESHGFVQQDGDAACCSNPFTDSLKCGRLISEISIERSTVEDDDWIIIRFAGPDAAVSRFKSPISNFDD